MGISHMDVQHAGVGVDIDELLKEAVKMNVKDKSSLKILNAEGKRVRGGGNGIKSRSKRATAVKRKRRRVKQQSSEDEELCGEEDESVQKDSAFEKQLQIRVIRLTDEQISEYKMNSS
ncbi:hypothetical protein Ocin01_17346 [Orchesella cincta]|uniref:Uncharacterized protein n=1 Tax=Orchesella cincta TaxID=48709 RepID=A0A1D2M8N1_ORCCI|nr:hypothetical protein Ocin01_17346 [Orchesella cincta]